MHHLHRDRLSEHLDRTLDAATAAELDRHLEACAECRDTLESLAAVRARAASLAAPGAPTDLWDGVAQRIGAPASVAGGAPARPARMLESPPPRRAPSPWRWLPVAAALAVVVGGLWVGTRGLRGGFPLRAVEPPTLGAPATDVASVAFDTARMESEIGELQAALERGRGQLDPGTVRVLEENLAVIRLAIDDAKRALAEDPANAELQDYLSDSVGRKLELVRRAAAMAGV
jgi:Putative zinc-finger